MWEELYQNNAEAGFLGGLNLSVEEYRRTGLSETGSTDQ